MAVVWIAAFASAACGHRTPPGPAPAPVARCSIGSGSTLTYEAPGSKPRALGSLTSYGASSLALDELEKALPTEPVVIEVVAALDTPWRLVSWVLVVIETGSNPASAIRIARRKGGEPSEDRVDLHRTRVRINAGATAWPVLLVQFLEPGPEAAGCTGCILRLAVADVEEGEPAAVSFQEDLPWRTTWAEAATLRARYQETQRDQHGIEAIRLYASHPLRARLTLKDVWDVLRALREVESAPIDLSGLQVPLPGT